MTTKAPAPNKSKRTTGVLLMVCAIIILTLVPLMYYLTPSSRIIAGFQLLGFGAAICLALAGFLRLAEARRSSQSQKLEGIPDWVLRAIQVIEPGARMKLCSGSTTLAIDIRTGQFLGNPGMYLYRNPEVPTMGYIPVGVPQAPDVDTPLSSDDTGVFIYCSSNRGLVVIVNQHHKQQGAPLYGVPEGRHQTVTVHTSRIKR